MLSADMVMPLFWKEIVAMNKRYRWRKEVRHRRMLSLIKEMKLLITNTKYKVPLRIHKSVFLFCSPVKRIKNLLKHPLVHFFSFSGKVSLCVSPSLKGSMTVEAALVLPFFLMVILSILSFIEIIQLQNGITMGLREAGMPMSVYGYVYKYVQDEGDVDLTGIIPNLALSYGYAGQKVEEFLGRDYLENAPLSYGVQSIQYYRSSIMEENDVIDLVALYAAEPKFNVALLPQLKLISRYYGRAWTGYELTGGSMISPAEENVYITPKGTVYHTSRYCTHLQLSIVSCPVEQVMDKKNESGSSYRACILCGGGYKMDKVYITSEGDCYHGSLKCSGLKRTIDVVPISQVSNRGKCSRCGG